MKFEKKYPDASVMDKFEFECSHITKQTKPGFCFRCKAFTKWFDILFTQYACSEECLGKMWNDYYDQQFWVNRRKNLDWHVEGVNIENEIIENAEDVWKDIIIVVRDQFSYFRECIESIRTNTKHFHLYIWDNGSKKETQAYIDKLVLEGLEATDWKISTMRSELNTGFIQPNNELVGWGESPYIILLNSDTRVFNKWDKLMTGFLAANPEVAQIGYWGGYMGPDGRGFGGSNGYDVDYIPGWCFCIKRKTYEEYGLFNQQLTFAYCEDADLSLRLKEAGKKIYALHSPYVLHHQNKTIKEVEREGQIDVAASFAHNHEYLKVRWKDYLANDRIILKKEKEFHVSIIEPLQSIAG